MKYTVTLGEKCYEVEVEAGQAMILDEYLAQAPAGKSVFTDAHLADNLSPASMANAKPETQAQISSQAGSQAQASTSAAEGQAVCAPLPGNILAIKVNIGQQVTEGQVLLLIEAMKMENEVVAPCDGTVGSIAVSTGQMVSTGDTLLTI